MKLSIVIPVYNEIDTLLEILRQVQAVPLEKEIIIVDDGSTDGTREVLRELKDENVRVFLNEKNSGKGYSIREGFKHVTGDIVIIQDADLEYYPDEYPLLIQKIVEGKADVVFGTRFMGARRVFHFYHYLGNTFLNLIANIMYDSNLSDLMTCYKAFKADIIKKLKLRANGFGIETEITAQLLKRQMRLYEVPISYDGRDYSEGKKINWRDFFRCVYWLLRCRFETYDVGEEILYRMRLMKNNNRWIFKRMEPYLGKVVLEVGSGIGNISNYLKNRDRFLVLTDIRPYYLNLLRRRFIGNPRVEVLEHNLESTDIQYIRDKKIDTVVCINVLEHVRDDDAALKNAHDILCPNGRLLLLVPAGKNLFGSLDKQLEHYRRYERNALRKQLEGKGFEVEKLFYHNMPSVIGWYLNSRILKKKTISSFQAKLLDRFIPLIAAVESKVNVPCGLSLIAVGRKK